METGDCSTELFSQAGLLRLRFWSMNLSLQWRRKLGLNIDKKQNIKEVLGSFGLLWFLQKVKRNIYLGNTLLGIFVFGSSFWMKNWNQYLLWEMFLKVKITYCWTHWLDRFENQESDRGSKKNTFFSESQMSVFPLRS